MNDCNPFHKNNLDYDIFVESLVFQDHWILVFVFSATKAKTWHTEPVGIHCPSDGREALGPFLLPCSYTRIGIMVPFLNDFGSP